MVFIFLRWVFFHNSGVNNNKIIMKMHKVQVDLFNAPQIGDEQPGVPICDGSVPLVQTGTSQPLDLMQSILLKKLLLWQMFHHESIKTKPVRGCFYGKYRLMNDV